MEKIKDSKVRCAILDHLHMVMFMSINPNETIDDFKARGRRWWKVLIIYNLVLFGQDIFGFIIANLVSKGSPLPSMA
jgi:predicted CDP-diglyceride synthetase/phosphatidate cytidylyltransferase